MHGSLTSCVKYSGCITDLFPCNIGSRQGDKTVLQCLPFSLLSYLHFLDKIVLLASLLQMKSQIFFCLMFADDIANCAETAARLQQQINVVDQFCSNTGMEVQCKSQ